jgi:hypothetical protein
MSMGHRLTVLKSVYDIKIRQGVPIEPEHYVPPCKAHSCHSSTSLMRGLQPWLQAGKIPWPRKMMLPESYSRSSFETNGSLTPSESFERSPRNIESCGRSFCPSFEWQRTARSRFPSIPTMIWRMIRWVSLLTPSRRRDEVAWACPTLRRRSMFFLARLHLQADQSLIFHSSRTINLPAAETSTRRPQPSQHQTT